MGGKKLNRILNSIGLQKRLILPSHKRFRPANAYNESIRHRRGGDLGIFWNIRHGQGFLDPFHCLTCLIKRIVHKDSDGTDIFVDEW